MPRKHHGERRTAVVSLVFAALTLAAAPASAKEVKRLVCNEPFAAYKSALEGEKAGRLREARDLFSTCARATACAAIAPKCASKYNEVSSRMPSVVPVVTDAAGAAVFDVQVKMDGEVLTKELNGRGLPIEPGAHSFAFSKDGQVFAVVPVLVVEGERNRRVEALFGPAATGTEIEKRTPDSAIAVKPSATPAASDTVGQRPEPTAPKPVNVGERPWAFPGSPTPYIVGIVGLSGAVAGGLLTYWGNKDNDLAKAQCNHLCPQSTVDHIRAMYIAADVSFGVAAVGLGVATWLFAGSRATETKLQSGAAYLDVKPTPSGGFVSVSGAF